jgi:uncharacterized protein (DUF1330 family)
MPAYFVYFCQKVNDREELETYWKKMRPTLEGYGAKSLAGYTPFLQLEGDPIEGATVVEFPSFELAKKWYESDAYRAVRHHRENGAQYIGILIEGGALPPEERMPQTKGR